MDGRITNQLVEQVVEALSTGDMTSANNIITDVPAILKFRRSDDGNNLLDIFAYASNIQVISWLCVKMQSLGFSIDTRNHNFSTIQRAYVEDRASVVEVLLKYTENPKLVPWYAQRQLVCIFGTDFLNNNFTFDKNFANAAEGGLITESVQIMSSAISKFAETHPGYLGLAKNIRNFNRNSLGLLSDTANIVANIMHRLDNRANPRVFFWSGYKNHVFSVSLKNNNNGSYQLTIYDSNLLDEAKSNSLNLLFLNKSRFVKRINIPAAEVPVIINELARCHYKPAQEVKDFLNNLEQRFNNRFIYDENILLDLANIEKNRCYWVNVREAVRDMFVDEFGFDQGEKNFNNFMAFIALKVVSNFKQALDDKCNPLAVNKLERLAQKKVDNSTFWTASRKNIFKKVLAMTVFFIGLVLLYVPIGISAALFPLYGPLAIIAPVIAGISMLVGSMLHSHFKNVIHIAVILIKGKFGLKVPLVLKNEECGPAFASSTEQINLTINNDTQPVERASLSSTAVLPAPLNYSAQFFSKLSNGKQPLTALETSAVLWDLPRLVS